MIVKYVTPNYNIPKQLWLYSRVPSVARLPLSYIRLHFLAPLQNSTEKNIYIIFTSSSASIVFSPVIENSSSNVVAIKQRYA